jgi:hypothetical protein
MIIIIILNLNLEVDLGQDLGHGSGYPSQRKDTSSYYHNFKTRIEIDLGHGSS